jgi:hypothetical protein
MPWEPSFPEIAPFNFRESCHCPVIDQEHIDAADSGEQAALVVQNDIQQ